MIIITWSRTKSHLTTEALHQHMLNTVLHSSSSN
jgi:hypothetical protein